MALKVVDILQQDLSQAPPKREGTEGLTSSEARELLEQEGENTLRGGHTVHPVKIFASQFKDMMVMILLVCTAVSVFMGEFTEAVAIAIIVFINALLGFFQELKTEKTLEALKNMAAPQASVYRDGALCKLPATQLVRGDVITVEAGDRVPADCVILDAVSLAAEEAVLTGESVPVDKKAGANKGSEQLSEQNELNRADLLYMGTTITKGRAKARVIATGMKTQMGKIAGMLNEIEEEPTPLQKRLAQLGKYIAAGCLIICLIVSAAGLLRGENFLDMLITGVSLAVAAVPEGLPAIVTIALALAVGRMVKRKALIRKLHAVETLGCASVICSDKTGTLTQNKMTVKAVCTMSHSLTVTGDGYEKAGGFESDGRRFYAAQDGDVKRLMEIAVLCNNAQLKSEKGGFVSRDRAVNKAKGVHQVLGDPTEAALLVMAAKAGILAGDLALEYEKIAENPFDSERKCMSVVVRDKSGKRFLLVKGACDVILNRCSSYQKEGAVSVLTGPAKKEILARNDQMANEALRVLGFAYRPVPEGSGDYKEDNLIFVGLTGMIDPPRREAKEAVKTCRRAGIKTIMITGDHLATARAIAAQIGIWHKGDHVFTGAQLDQMDDEELAGVVENTTVFARVSPHHKLRIVRALKQHGHVVAMTGDGVNDAPAIKEADIGVSMGISGTDVTKEASEVILLDDNFATLVTAVEEGRVIYSNIRKFIRYLLSCNIGEVLTMFLGMLMGLPVVLLPIQILLVNLVTDGLPAIALGLEPPEKDIMNKKPRKASDSVFSDGLLTTIIFRGCLIGLTTLAIFVTLFRMSLSVDVARTGAFLGLVMAQLIHVFECKSEVKNVFTVPYLNNIKLVLAASLSGITIFSVIYIKALRPIFSTVPLTGTHVLVVIGFCLAAPVLSAVFSLFRRKKSGDITLDMTGKLG